MDGASIYARSCAGCHGREGRGGIAQADGGAAPRNFVNAEFHRARTDADLRAAIVGGKGAMPAFGDFFTEEELHALVKRLRRFNPDAG